MKTRDIFSYSFSAIKLRKLRAGLTVLGVVIGIAAIVALLSITQGFQTTITGQLEKGFAADTLVITTNTGGNGFGPGGGGGFGGVFTAKELARKGRDKFDVELIGASITAIKVAEDRQLFKDAMREIGLDVPQSGVARALPEAVELARTLGFPLVIRPSFTLGGVGGGIELGAGIAQRRVIENGVDVE